MLQTTPAPPLVPPGAGDAWVVWLVVGLLLIAGFTCGWWLRHRGRNRNSR